MYKQKVIWIGTVLGDSSTKEFEDSFLNELGFHVKYEEEFKMLDGFYKDLTCIVFSICVKEISKFALFRIKTGDMKWWEDFYDAEKENIPARIIKKYNTIS